jgi:hypothetical protein
MERTNYNVEWVLQLVRASFSEQMGDLSCKVFFERLWRKLEAVNDPGVIKPLTCSISSRNNARFVFFEYRSNPVVIASVCCLM